MKFKIVPNLFITLSFFLLVQSCKNEKKINTIDIQGHRGCRGLMPENSIPAFINALEIGVNTLEMDVVISKDKQVVVSHESVLSHEICFNEQGIEISEDDEILFNLYKMNYDEIKKCDCGTKHHPRFPDQQKMKVYKPLLAEVIDSVEQYLKKHSLPLVAYNIEIKSSPETDRIFHPLPADYAGLVMNIIKEKNISDRVIIQSFDVRALQEMKKKYPEIKLSLLVENRVNPEKTVEKLGFTPDIYSPEHLFVNEELMDYAGKNNMKVVPWTVNEKEEIISVLKLGVDGIITDYPDSAKEVVKEFLAAKK